jgi:hypothetical protein
MKYFLALIFLAANIAQAQYRLALNLEKGSTYFQRTSATVTINEDVNGQKININTTVSGAMSFKVIDKTGSDYELETAYTELAMTMKTPNGEVSFSSAKPADDKDVFSILLRNMLNHPFRITMQSNGKIKEVKGIDSMWNNLMVGLPEMDEAKKTQILNQLKQSYGENSVRGNIEQLTAIFPDGKVKINDVWENKIELKTTMVALVTNHFKLVSYDKQFAEIDDSADTKTTDAETQVNGLPAVYNLTGPTNSKIKIDTKTGWIAEATIKQNLKGTINIKDNPQVPGGLSIPMELISDSKVSDK